MVRDTSLRPSHRARPGQGPPRSLGGTNTIVPSGDIRLACQNKCGGWVAAQMTGAGYVCLLFMHDSLCGVLLEGATKSGGK